MLSSLSSSIFFIFELLLNVIKTVKRVNINPEIVKLIFVISLVIETDSSLEGKLK